MVAGWWVAMVLAALHRTLAGVDDLRGGDGRYSRDVFAGVSTAAHAARVVREILSNDSGALVDAWRHGVLQLLDDYERVRRRSGSGVAAELFVDVPPRSGDVRVDAALAGLAEHLARRDGWRPPSWAFEPSRYAEPWWFVADLRSLRPMALVRSPTAFRKRGVFITANALERV